MDDASGFSFAHRREAFSDEVHRAEVVDEHLALFVFNGHVFDDRAIGNACVVDQDVDGAPAFGGISYDL